ncbi:synaptotagmin-6-like [Acipenser oxyrinchus oxyrinchus]|uniref:Synaptotagmin-6-like n=1 Tax=Acipenser oxyrinchus oxyrinchus TaxID=40147 RepID=A0AAD8D131_ACIOX|nr:synaptotagmin-6-like [Acipenser oxyrinchus oxyrinchus]
MSSPGSFRLSFTNLRMPFSDGVKYTLLGISVSLFAIASLILTWQLYRYCKRKPKPSGKVKSYQSVDDKQAGNTIFEAADKESDIQKHDYKVQKLEDEIKKLSRCLSATSSISEQDSADFQSITEADAQVNIHGKLRFSLSYDREQSQFALTVLDATGLPVQDFSQSTDPFVKVKLLSGSLSEQPNLQCVLQEWETKTVKNSRNPVFGSQFSCPLTEKELKTITVKFEVRDFDRFSRHSVLGEVRARLNNLNLLSHPVEISEELQKLNKDLVGEILLSLKYLPTAQRIEVGLLKIKTASLTSNQDKALYARVTIVCNQCRLKQQKTSLKSKWGITVFNEVLTFSLLDSNIRECVIAVSVYETIVNQKNSKRLIGQAILGKRKAGEDEHWCLMMQSLRQPIAKWHSLLI